jgi:hypothetical protein
MRGGGGPVLVDDGDRAEDLLAAAQVPAGRGDRPARGGVGDAPGAAAELLVAGADQTAGRPPPA